MAFRVRDAVVALVAACAMSPLAPAPVQAATRFEGFCSFQNQVESEAARATMTVKEQLNDFLQIHWHNDGGVSSFDLVNNSTIRDQTGDTWTVVEAEGNTLRLSRNNDGAVIACYSG